MCNINYGLIIYISYPYAVTLSTTTCLLTCFKSLPASDVFVACLDYNKENRNKIITNFHLAIERR